VPRLDLRLHESNHGNGSSNGGGGGSGPAVWLRALQALRTLEWLRLSWGQVPKAAWPLLTGVQGLRCLAIDRCAHLTDAALGALGALPHLTALSLAHCELVTTAGLRTLAGHSARRSAPLVELQLAHCGGIRSVPPPLSVTLERLALVRQAAATVAGFFAVSKAAAAVTAPDAAWPRLRHLVLDKVTRAAEELPALNRLRLPTTLRTLAWTHTSWRQNAVGPLEPLPLVLPELWALDLSGSLFGRVAWTSVLLPALAAHLRWLDCSMTDFNDVADLGVGARCATPNLETLLLRNGAVSGGPAEAAALRTLPSLGLLDVRGCPLTEPLRLALALQPGVRVVWQDHEDLDEDNDPDASLRRRPHQPRAHTWQEIAGFLL